MYNAEIKNQYLTSQQEFFARYNRKRNFTNDDAIRFFDWIEPVEKDEEADFAELRTPWQGQRSVTALLRGADSANGVSADILGKIAVSYCTWYSKEHSPQTIYNPELKTAFLRDNGYNAGTIRNYTRLFSTLCPYETAANADICTFSLDKATEALSAFSSNAPTTKANFIGMLRRYIVWCCSKGVPNANQKLADINSIEFSGLRDTMLANPLHLARYLDQIFSPVSDGTMDNIYRAFYWIAFAGIPKKEAFALTCDDVDLERLVIRVGDDEFPIYREGYEVISFAVRSESVYAHRFGTYLAYKRAPGNMLLRSTNGVPGDAAFMNTMKAKAVQAGLGDSAKTYSNVLKSGYFYRAFEFECATGIEPDFSEIAKRYHDKKGSKDKRIREGYMKRNYAENYRQWKMAFIR